MSVRDDWNADGPAIPVEFARQSNNGRITLVVTPGAPDVTVLWARLELANIEAAKRELARREGIEPRHTDSNIGFWTPERASPHLEAEKIGAWANERNLGGVVWTALRPKFGNAYRTPTEREIVDYLAGLKGDVRMQAETYCRLAPPQIRTPYRAAIEAALDWGYNADMTQGTDTTTRHREKLVE